MQGKEFDKGEMLVSTGLMAIQRLLGTVVLGVCLPIEIHAASLAWTNGGSDGVWSNTSNWNPAQLPAAGDTLTLGNSSPDTAQSITLSGPGVTSRFSLNATGNRTYTISGSTLEFRQSGTTTAQIAWNNSAGRQNVTINTDILLSRDDETQSAALTITSGFGDATLTINGNISGSTGVGYGVRTMSYGASNRLVMNGSSSLSALTWSRGEIVAGSSSALGAGSVQVASGGQTTLSLRSDLTIGVNASAQSWSTNQNTFLRIAEDLPGGTQDRSITFGGRLAQTGAGGQLTMIDNVNTSGRLILNLTDTSATAHNVNVELNSSALLRFAQDGNKTYSGILSGDGEVEVDSTDTTTLSAANTYTGKTTIAAGTLLLAVGGSIANSSEINLGTVGSQGTLDVTSKASFAFGASQTVSGFGTINIGAGKTVSVAGNLNPGNSPGQVNVTGNLALENTTVTTMELAGDGGVRGTDFDNVTATGSLVYDGTLSIVSFGGFNLFQDGTYSLFDFASQSGNFDAVSFGGNALTYDAGVWSGSSGGYGYQLTLSTGDLVVTGVIPEPGTAGLVALAAVWLLGLRRRERLSA